MTLYLEYVARWFDGTVLVVASGVILHSLYKLRQLWRGRRGRRG